MVTWRTRDTEEFKGVFGFVNSRLRYKIVNYDVACRLNLVDEYLDVRSLGNFDSEDTAKDRAEEHAKEYYTSWWRRLFS